MPQPSTPDVIIRIDQIKKSFRLGQIETHVLRGVSVVVPRGCFAAIVGPSGCGKTTLLSLLGGLDKADSGMLEVDGVDLAKMSPSELNLYRRAKIGFVFQFYNLLPSLTALENVESGLEFLPLTSKQKQQRALDYLDRVGMADNARKFPAQLSGGQQQRVAVARALAREPALLLADEPTGNLDQESGKLVFECIQELQRSLKVTCVMVTHDPALAAKADRIVRMRDGRVVDGSVLAVGAAS